MYVYSLRVKIHSLLLNIYSIQVKYIHIYTNTCMYIYVSIYIYIYYYTPLPLNLANKQASNKQASKHFSFSFWPLLRCNAPGSTLL